MSAAKMLRFLPSMEMIAEEFIALGWQCQPDIANKTHFCGVRLFNRQGTLEMVIGNSLK